VETVGLGHLLFQQSCLLLVKGKTSAERIMSAVAAVGLVLTLPVKPLGDLVVVEMA
jgi:hypothetical protein